MRISRIQITGFRNFQALDVRLGSSSVFVGENMVGKSNLVHAARLVLDPSLPEALRMLRIEDFWDGFAKPIESKCQIEVSVELSDFESNENHCALLCDYLVSGEPMVARLTYLFRPRPDRPTPTKESDYEWLVYGGGRLDNIVSSETRRRLPLDVLAALRDAEGDLANWRRSPLRPLLEHVAASIPDDVLDAVAEEIDKATASLSKNDHIAALASSIKARLDDMTSKSHAVDPELRLSPADGARLIRAIRLYVDAGKRPVDDASLGSANLIYLALKALELRFLADQGARDHTFLAIEEPEAHLHPHLQRLVFRDLLRTREPDGVGQTEEGRPAGLQTRASVLLTTHSPHIVSVAPLRSIVLMRRDSATGSTTARSTADLDLDQKEVDDLERYIDVTRGEILFAKGVVLVEGEAERFLLPRLAAKIGVDLDGRGISVCSVNGTSFGPYVKLLGTLGLDVPSAILTDWDPRNEGEALGSSRAKALLSLFGRSTSALADLDEESLRGQAASEGVFLGTYTLEVDLFVAGGHQAMRSAFGEVSGNSAAVQRFADWASTPAHLDAEQMLRDINEVGKGRFAQRLAAHSDELHCPTYIEQAIRYVCAQIE